MKDEQTLISDFEKEALKLLEIVKKLQKHNENIIIKCQDNMITLCIDNRDSIDDLQFAEDISKNIDFTGYMETIG